MNENGRNIALIKEAQIKKTWLFNYFILIEVLEFKICAALVKQTTQKLPFCFTKRPKFGLYMKETPVL